MNLEMMQKVRDRIDELPAENFDMADYGYLKEDCGTVACIAGHACLLDGAEVREEEARPSVVYVNFWKDDQIIDPDIHGGQILGLSQRQRHHMFQGFWSQKPPGKISKGAVLRYLDKVIETGSVYVEAD